MTVTVKKDKVNPVAVQFMLVRIPICKLEEMLIEISVVQTII